MVLGFFLIGLIFLKCNGMYVDMYVVKEISIIYILLGYRLRRILKFVLWDVFKYGYVGFFEWV